MLFLDCLPSLWARAAGLVVGGFPMLLSRLAYLHVFFEPKLGCFMPCLS